MPHQCTNCDHLFPDGSKQMLSGCPDCGGSKFQFLPSTAVDDEAVAGSAVADTPDTDGDMQFGHAPAEADDGTRGDAAVGSETSPAGGDQSGSEQPGSDQEMDQEIIDADARAEVPPEDTAQADARSTVISDEEIRGATPRPTEVEEADEEGDETPDLSALRAELNEQFESIKILEPGQYELNLMELYDREEYIIALEEDGRYAIEVPDSWREDEE